MEGEQEAFDASSGHSRTGSQARRQGPSMGTAGEISQLTDHSLTASIDERAIGQ